MIQTDYMPIGYNAGAFYVYRPYWAYATAHYGGYGYEAAAYSPIVMPLPVYGYGFSPIY